MSILKTESRPFSGNHPYRAYGRVYVWEHNETVLQNLFNRRSRPCREYRPIVLEVLKERYGITDPTKVKWSQKAGCACGCSPGFIVKTLHEDLHLTITNDPE